MAAASLTSKDCFQPSGGFCFGLVQDGGEGHVQPLTSQTFAPPWDVVKNPSAANPAEARSGPRKGGSMRMAERSVRTAQNHGTHGTASPDCRSMGWCQGSLVKTRWCHIYPDATCLAVRTAEWCGQGWWCQGGEWGGICSSPMECMGYGDLSQNGKTHITPSKTRRSILFV